MIVWIFTDDSLEEHVDKICCMMMEDGNDNNVRYYYLNLYIVEMK